MWLLFCMGGTNIFWIPYNWLILLYGSTICMRAKFKKIGKNYNLFKPCAHEPTWVLTLWSIQV